MKPRGFALIPLLPYIIGGIAVASLAGWLWWKADHWCNRACAEATERATVAEEAIRIAQERATHLALLWADAVQRTEVRYVEVVREREQKFAGIRERAGQIGYSGGIALSPDAVGVLSDAARAANDSGSPTGDSPATAAIPEPAGGDRDQPAPADTSPAQWVAFAVNAAEAYSDAREKWAACVAFVDSLRGAQ